jgi:soluble lytic murein transglycosylase-like protein
MPELRAGYASRGVRERRRLRARRALVLTSLLGSCALALNEHRATVASAAPVPSPSDSQTTTSLPVWLTPPVSKTASLAPRLPGALARPIADAPTPEQEQKEMKRELARWRRVYHFADRYRIGTDLSKAIHDAALAEGLEPEIAFRLVAVESEFNERATSPVGAVGLTQLMPSTAKYFVKGVTRAQLYERHLNLRVGFRYLRTLIGQYKSLRLALLAYNRGPYAVQASLDAGRDPANGYEKAVMQGYRGRGLLRD